MRLQTLRFSIVFQQPEMFQPPEIEGRDPVWAPLLSWLSFQCGKIAFALS